MRQNGGDAGADRTSFDQGPVTHRNARDVRDRVEWARGQDADTYAGFAGSRPR
jgi:hypothetical protein